MAFVRNFRIVRNYNQMIKWILTKIIARKLIADGIIKIKFVYRRLLKDFVQIMTLLIVKQHHNK